MINVKDLTEKNPRCICRCIIHSINVVVGNILSCFYGKGGLEG